MAATRSRSGVTLMEMIVVMTIVAVVALLTFPKMDATMTDERVNHAAIQLSTQLQAAFTLALRDRKPIQISFDNVKVQFTVADRAGNVFYRTGLSDFNLKASNVTPSRNVVEVYPQGLAQDSLSITLTASADGASFTRRVRMTRGGLVQVL